MIYIIILIYTLFLSYHYDIRNNKRGLKFHYYALLIIVCSLVGFSYRLGMDTVGYMKYYETYIIPDIGYAIRHLSDYRYEPLFTILCTVCKSIWEDFVLLQLVIAVFVNTVVFWFIKKHSKKFFFAIFLFFIFQFWNINFEIKRESIAIAFFLLAMDNVLENEVKLKNYLRYYLWCIPALLSHRFAFIILFFPILCRIKWSKLSFAIVIGAVFLLILDIPIINIITNNLNLLTIFDVQDSVATYLTSDRFGASNKVSIFGLINGFLIPSVILYNVRNIVDKRVFSLAVLCLAFQVLESQIFIFYRFCNYLFFFLIICYSEGMRIAVEEKNNRALLQGAVILLVFLQLYGRVQPEQYIRYAPYSSVFSKEINSEREAEYDRLDFMLNY